MRTTLSARGDARARAVERYLAAKDALHKLTERHRANIRKATDQAAAARKKLCNAMAGRTDAIVTPVRHGDRLLRVRNAATQTYNSISPVALQNAVGKVGADEMKRAAGKAKAANGNGTTASLWHVFHACVVARLKENWVPNASVSVDLAPPSTAATPPESCPGVDLREVGRNAGRLMRARGELRGYHDAHRDAKLAQEAELERAQGDLVVLLESQTAYGDLGPSRAPATNERRVVYCATKARPRLHKMAAVAAPEWIDRVYERLPEVAMGASIAHQAKYSASAAEALLRLKSSDGAELRLLVSRAYEAWREEERAERSSLKRLKVLPATAPRKTTRKVSKQTPTSRRA